MSSGLMTAWEAELLLELRRPLPTPLKKSQMELHKGQFWSCKKKRKEQREAAVSTTTIFASM